MSPIPFSPQLLLSRTKLLPESNCYRIAYSGGMDSHVLLHALCEIRDSLQVNITAIHIDHGINKLSGEWAKHCNRICTGLGIELVTHRIENKCPKGESIESWARCRRYEIFRECMGTGDILLTAQHLDDQAETLLLQLLRGAGPKGLSAMPELRRFGPGWMARPLLDVARDGLREYAVMQGLSWIEDDMNEDLSFDRSFIRHGILPELKERWPNISRVLSRASAHQAEASELLDDLSALDLPAFELSVPDALSLDGFFDLSEARRRNVIRYWLRKLGMPIPDSSILSHILTDVAGSRYDASPCITWQGIEIRRYGNILHAARKQGNHDSSMAATWDLGIPYHTNLGDLQAVRGRGPGIKAAAIPDQKLVVGYRQGGESIRPATGRHHRALKKLMQEQRIPPWFRDRIPLLYLNKELVAVAGFWIEDRYYAGPDEDAWQITWEGVDKVVFK